MPDFNYLPGVCAPIASGKYLNVDYNNNIGCPLTWHPEGYSEPQELVNNHHCADDRSAYTRPNSGPGGGRVHDDT